MIVGAGPVGLAAGLFLARRGRTPPIVERRDAPSQRSKALAVNPRTLAILEPSGVSERLLAHGRRIRGAQFHVDGRVAVDLDFEGLPSRFPFMLALSQATTERLLGEALVAAGGKVERGVELVGCRPDGDAVETTLETTDGARSRLRYPWLLAADGAHSTARSELGIPFEGGSFAAEWHLVDVALRTPLDENRAHLFVVGDAGFVFALRVVDAALEAASPGPLWRVIANAPHPLAWLDDARPLAEPVWQSSFPIAHRTAARFSQQGVHLAGDAAHVHSPVGARGMNLGIEDAAVFAALEAEGRLGAYEALRRPVDRRVVARIERISSVVGGVSWLDRQLRRLAFPHLLRTGIARRQMLRMVSGLDHPLPDVLKRQRG